MLAALVLAAGAAPTSVGLAAAFSDFKATFGRTYGSAAEEQRRYAAFAQSAHEVAEINADPTSTWTAGINEFSDMTWDEFRSTILMKAQNCSATGRRGGGHRKTGTAPPQIDWRDYHALNGVKNQGHCGSCWTFSTTGCLESHVYLKTGNMPNISEQQLVDCAGAFNNHGCNGGLPSQAYEYIHYAGGIDPEKAYPYNASTGTCHFKRSAVVAKVAGVVNITEGDEEELEDAVGSIGPVSVAYEVSADFRHYTGGVYDGVCHQDTQHVNHAVVAVGYGTSDDGAPYWTIRNSWGTGWGEAGHFRMARGKNKCGIAVCASYPLVI